MASLLDRVLDNKDNPKIDNLLSPADDLPHTLEDGSVVYDSTIAAINRILQLNPHLHKRMTVHGDYQLYNGRKPVDLDDKLTFLSLIRADWTPATPWQMAFLHNKVLELVPVLSKDCIVVSEGLIWDRNAGKLQKFQKGDNIRSVS